MKATEAKALQALGNAPQLMIPIFHRAYSWSLNECQPLLASSQRVCPKSLGIWPKRNSDVELGAATLNELPHAQGLTRQSLERQLDNDEGAN